MNPLQPKAMFVFPGQGSQYKGMGRDIDQEFPPARRIYERASEVVGYDMRELSFQDPEEKLAKTEFTQVALLTHSMACLEVFRDTTEDRLKPAVVAGHSLGEYSALVAAGALTFEAALKLVKRRGELMGKYGRGKMVAVRMDVEKVRSFANSFYCDVGGCNLPNQTVVGGAEQDLAAFVSYVAEKHKVRAIPLNTEGAFHTFWMMEAALEFRQTLDSVDFEVPSVPVLSNYSADYHDPASIKPFLFYQLFNPVKWIWGLQRALRDGANMIIEFGGGLGEGNEPSAKRPNLETITRRAINDTKENVAYAAAIHSGSLTKLNRFVRALGSVRASDESLTKSAGEKCRLDFPIENGMPSERGRSLIETVIDNGLEGAVQLVGYPAASYATEVSADGTPHLECSAAPEDGASVHYYGDDVSAEIKRLATIRNHPGSRELQASTKP